MQLCDTADYKSALPALRRGLVAVLPPGICLGLVLVGLNLLAGSAKAGGDETEVDRAVVPVVCGMPRPTNTDLVLLDNGEALKGTILNENFSLRTSYAQLSIGTRVLAGIDLAGAAGGVHTVFAINGNRFTGLVEDAALSFQPEAGTRIEIRRERITRVIFGIREGERGGMGQGKWLLLRNGDRLSGQILAAPLVAVTASGEVPVDLKDVRSVSMSGKGPTPAKIALLDGRVLPGTLGVKDWAIQLEVGPKLNLYPGSIERICDSIEEAPESVTAGSRPMIPAGVGAPRLAPGATHLAGLVWIPPGEFTMGSPYDEAGRDPDEGPQTRVSIPQGFWMSQYEVTQAQYVRVMGTNPSNITDDAARPVEKVNWHEALEYCRKLTEQTQAAGQLPAGYAFRLPTEAEWEYACRAGTTTRFSYGEDKSDSQLGNYAWFSGNSDSTTHPVGTRRPSPWGLYDMHGNVWEWCLDRWESALPGGSITNQPVAAEGRLRVARGGSWLYDPKACRSANRDDYSPSDRCSDLGFRVVLALIAR